MKKRIVLLILGLFAAGLLYGGFSALAQDRDSFKELMSNNYAKVTGILANLLTDMHYDQVLKDIALISEHADMLQELNPEKTVHDRKQFKAYAAQLKGNVDNLAVIVRHILEEKKTGSKPNNFLRPVAATHFGNVVTMCVSCHNQFRP